MGEKPTGRMLMLAGLLVTSLFIGMASADEGGVALEAVPQTSSDRSWYSPDQPLVLVPTLANSGPDITLTVNPSCLLYINVYNATGVQVVDGAEACPVREQGLDVFAGERIEYEPVTWSMRDSAGAWLHSGEYTVELMHSSGVSTASVVTVQTPVALPDGVVYSVETSQRTVAGPVLHMVNLHNPSAESVALPSTTPCSLEITVDSVHRLGASCTSNVDLLMPGEMILVEQFSVGSSSSVSIATSGASPFYNHAPAANNPPSPPALEMVLALSGNELPSFGSNDVLVSEVLLHNPLDDQAVLEFTTSCKAEMWVVDDLGNVVFDSRDETNCLDIELEMTLDSEETERFTLPQWNFFTADGCKAEPGVYTVVAELPELGMSATQRLDFHPGEANPCTSVQSASLAATLEWSSDDTLRVSPAVSSLEPHHLRMAQPCSFEVEFFDEQQTSVHMFQTLCDAYDGRKVLLPGDSESLQFDALDVRLVQDGTPILADGFYTMRLTVLSTSAASTSMPFAWPADYTDAEEADSSPSEPDTFELVGTWVGLLTDQGTCHMMEADGSTYLLSNARTVPTWRPSSLVEGVYVVSNAEASPACSDYLAPSVEVHEVRMESPLQSEDDAAGAAATPVEDNQETASPTAAASVITVVITTSVLSLLVVTTLTNEGLRIPATAAGLWFLGLIGKTHETTDGRYQRGRLMGYLTANPGCHFRALMSALDMSNGQITHHLRVLETEEHVWRKSDGRLVRFYPFTNQLHPNMPEDELPVPPLSPDPNSLQGKILNVLDHDGGLGQFPTQAELAKRLEKSQQLISHHLRTLQKFGLVERRKMGVKNRYKLTREAVFLLETSDDFTKDDLA